MRKMQLSFVVALLLIAISMKGQSYDTLWMQVERAQDSDLPQTAMTELLKIEAKAERENAYGQLLKSSLLYAKLQAEVAPDSMAFAVKRLEQKERQTQNAALKAVYDAVLSRIYGDNPQLAENWKEKRDDFSRRAMAHPEELAQVKADDYVPFVVKRSDSELFGDDLLSVIGMELKEWQWLSNYYDRAGNCHAACWAALEHVKLSRPRGHHPLARSSYIHQLDSLLEVYGDLPESCEVAIERYQYMNSHTDATADMKYDWLQQSLKRWGSCPRAEVFRNELTVLENPAYQIQMKERVVEVNRPQTVKLLSLRHLQSLTMRVYRTRLEGDTNLNPDEDADYEKMKAGLSELTKMSRTLTFSNHADYELFEDSVLLGGLPAGVYMVEFTSHPQTRTRRSLYFVSGLRLLMQTLPNEKTRFVVVDATTGQPVSKASLRLSFSTGWKKAPKTETMTCDKNGELVYGSKMSLSSVYAYTEADKGFPSVNGYGRYSYYERKYNVEHVNLLTDRSIYRPGQTVYVTAVAWMEQSATENVALEGKSLTLELRDANFKLIGEQSATTDRFGKCSAQFLLPTGLLNGRFSIRAGGGSVSFRVEEYKRPTFQVEFADYQESYQAGDVVHAQAKALTYAGVPVQNARVKYTVKRRVAFWWMSYSWYWQGGYVGRGLEEEVLNEGETTTADDGTFVVDMPMTLPGDLGSSPMFYHFVAEADVTDMAGETHSGTTLLPLGNKPTALTCDLPRQVRADLLPSVTFNRRNAAGKEIAGTVSYRIDGGKWQQCAANEPCPILSASYKSGEHRLEAVCETDSTDMTFVVFGLDDKKPAAKTHDWFYVSHEQFPEDGQPVTVQVGSSDSNLYMVYGIFAGNQQIESGYVKKSAALLNRQFTYQEEYGNGLLLTFAWVKNGQCYRHQTFIRRPVPEKKLTMEWETFRDRLVPGQHEEWRLTVKNADGTPADASLLAVLYDKSLDAILSHKWSFSPVNYLSSPSASWQWHEWGGIGLRGAKDYQLQSVREFTFSSFNDDVFPVYQYVMRIRGVQPVMAMSMVGATAKTSIGTYENVDGAAMKTAEVVVASNANGVAEDAQQEEKAAEDVQLRENMDETAFCYPALETDKDGVVTLKFTMPESLTTWRFMGMANTPDMSYGSIEAETVAKKDVMIQPNMPRFIRMGDEAVITARIFNTADHAVSGQARLQLMNPESEQSVYERTESFSVEAGKTATVAYRLSLSNVSSSLLICKVTAQGDGFSDGEQHYLPVLPDRDYVTKTVPYTQHEPGVKTISLSKLFPQGTTQQKLTVEYTNNPAWLMIQSLPVVGQPWEFSAIDMAASYYSNLLAKTLLAQNPRVKTTFEQWKREQGSEKTLMSQLQKNQELKDLVLEETPWVSDASREAEQKQRLADFFDENGIDNRLSVAVEKLKKLQNGDGSFSWYPGMEGSTSITVAVEEMLARLSKVADMPASIEQLQNRAFDFIGTEMTDLVAQMKAAEKKGVKPTFPSFTALRWLYICALDGRQLSGEVKSANDYLIALLKKAIKRQTIYEKALTAVVLAQHGDKSMAADYIKSLKEYTVYSEEMGRYYDTRRATYSWYDYKIPTEVAAIEAIRLVTPKDQQTVDEMRRWLLQEKRTQAWSTPVNSVNAIWAFLDADSQTLAAATPATVLAIDGSPVNIPAATAGLGYVKTAIDNPKGKTFTATKSSKGTSWGAVYAQFFQKSSEIEASQSGITVKRELLTANNQLTVGSRVKVRITIETKRDLDFVQVIDHRAACMEPVRQLSGYQNGAYVSPKDAATHYFYYGLAKGKHVIETEYYIDRPGQYETGTCTVGCAYAPEYRATAPSHVLRVIE